MGKSRDIPGTDRTQQTWDLRMRSGGEVPRYLGKFQDIPRQERQVGKY